MARNQKEIKRKLQIERQVLLAQLQNKRYQDTSRTCPVNPVDIQMQGRLDMRLASIERAILRLEKGTFGLCQSCGEEIETARLEALPYAEQCIDCQRKLERKVIQRYAYA